MRRVEDNVAVHEIVIKRKQLRNQLKNMDGLLDTSRIGYICTIRGALRKKSAGAVDEWNIKLRLAGLCEIWVKSKEYCLI